MFGHVYDHPVSEVARFFVYRSGLTNVSTRNRVPMVARKHDRKTVVRKRSAILKEQKQVSRLGNENQFQTQQELIQSVNEDPSQLIFERTLRRELYTINI